MPTFDITWNRRKLEWRKPRFESSSSQDIEAASNTIVELARNSDDQSGHKDLPHIKTEEAAKKAGAFVTPTDPKLAPNTPEGP